VTNVLAKEETPLTIGSRARRLETFRICCNALVERDLTHCVTMRNLTAFAFLDRELYRKATPICRKSEEVDDSRNVDRDA
jgi:hypothetical protein